MHRLLFENPNQNPTFRLPISPVDALPINIPDEYRRDDLSELPTISENEVVRHFTRLSHLAYGVDDGFYPLGSCTMKYNPKVNEWAARLPGLVGLHPSLPPELTQGALELMYDLEKMLCEIAGMDRFSLQPAAGAHGEMTGALIIKAYHQSRGDDKRQRMIVPDSAHGTNPATANMVGYKVSQVKSNAEGLVDIAHLESLLGDDVAGIMLTNPNTLGLFEEQIITIARLVHEAGGLLYYDGANTNGIMGVVRPGDMGFDVVHLNLHKTFSTPHGGGGPGSGPIGVKSHLVPFLPVPLVEKNDQGFYLDYDLPESIGKVHSYYGNFGIMVRAYCYILALGGSGLQEVCENAVLNANYIRFHLQDTYSIPFNRLCKHEFVATGKPFKKEFGVSTLDIAKRLLDYGYHPPTIYFPLIVDEALMVEPTETESRERLDNFIQAMKQIATEAKNNPELVTGAPHNTKFKRMDEVKAARTPQLRWRFRSQE
ncbi:MAG: aminomethyl-transferring glycine dehydrogenase subunit GcvPB [Methylocystaceae bacterium]